MVVVSARSIDWYFYTPLRQGGAFWERRLGLSLLLSGFASAPTPFRIVAEAYRYWRTEASTQYFGLAFYPA